MKKKIIAAAMAGLFALGAIAGYSAPHDSAMPFHGHHHVTAMHYHG